MRFDSRDRIAGIVYTRHPGNLDVRLGRDNTPGVHKRIREPADPTPSRRIRRDERDEHVGGHGPPTPAQRPG